MEWLGTVSYRVLCPSDLIIDSKGRLQERICDLIVSRNFFQKYRPIEQKYLPVVECLQPKKKMKMREERPEMKFAKHAEKDIKYLKILCWYISTE